MGIDQEALASKSQVTWQAVIKIEADERDRWIRVVSRFFNRCNKSSKTITGLNFFDASENSREGVRFRK